MLKRKYRYGKRSAMPYRFGKKRNWQAGSDDRADNSEANDELDDLFQRAIYRYGRK